MTRYLYIAAAALLLAGYLYWHHSVFAAGGAEVTASVTAKSDKVVAQEAAKAVQAEAGAKDATDTGHTAGADNTVKTQVVTRTITRIVHDAPSPAACVLRHDSLRTLQDAADSANSAAQGVVR